MPRSIGTKRARLILPVPQRSPSGPRSPKARDRAEWPFFPSYNPLDDEPPPERLRRRVTRAARAIAIKAAWRTGLFAVAAEVFYFTFVSHGWLVEVVR